MEKFVYHGSKNELDGKLAVPKRNIRTQSNEQGEKKVIFDEESFHATPHKWIALAYTCHEAPHEMDGKTSHYGMGVDLYSNSKTVHIFGFHSLEESLQVMYGSGGYVYHFGPDEFIYKEGLGDMEVVALKPVKPITIERINNPVDEMRQLGVQFEFVDLSLSENERFRDYSKS